MRIARGLYRYARQWTENYLQKYKATLEENNIPIPPWLEDDIGASVSAPSVAKPGRTLTPAACPGCGGTCGDEGSVECRVRRIAAMRTEENPREDLTVLQALYEDAGEAVDVLCFVAPHDEAVYSWKIDTEREVLPAVKLAMNIMVIPMLGLYAVLAALELLLPRTTMWLAIFVVYVCSFGAFTSIGRSVLQMFTYLKANTKEWPEYLRARYEPFLHWYSDRIADVSIVVMRFMIVPVVAFIIGSPHFWFRDGFSGETDSRLFWALHTVQLFFNTVTFDTLEILGISSPITPTSIAARASIVILKVIIGLIIASTIYDLVRYSREPLLFVGTGDELWSRITGLKVGSVKKIVKLGRVTMYDPPYVLEMENSKGKPSLRQGHE